ncbi:hypothetical protein N0B51_10280 [Tsuneonella sp. YG55]|uniref:Lipoprotein n=1 Tax=Tsuneonella litorea TaxID=2976475 RepID=A0A9X3A9Y9_9SPHN|nr:hypothetical protein [Tsuneonella litorea]MCT2559365.1 hypothetical protein [Tsuneonella litorea]
MKAMTRKIVVLAAALGLAACATVGGTMALDPEAQVPEAGEDVR